MTNDASSSGTSLDPRRRRTTLRGSSVGWFVVGVLTTASLVIVSTSQWSAAAVPGDDATLVPITPCRLTDTRPAPDRVGPNASLGIDDTTTIVAHGSNGECTIPDDAIALLLNVTAVGATEGTFLTIWPGGARPLASSLNPAAGQPPTPNAVTTSLSTAGSFNVYNLAGSVDVVIDVGGYYTSSTLEDLTSALDAAEGELSQLRSEVDALRDGTSTLRSGVTLTGFEWISEVIVADDTPRSSLFSFPRSIASLELSVPMRFTPESGPDDLVVDTFEDARCSGTASDPVPDPGVMCIYPITPANIDMIGVSESGLVGEIFVTFDHDGEQGDLVTFGFLWAFTAP